jgi:hypothetical protein
MKLLAILLLSIASIAVLAVVVLLAATLILGLGIDVPNGWARRGVLCVFFASMALARLWLIIARCFWQGNMEACPLNSTFPHSAFIKH